MKYFFAKIEEKAVKLEAAGTYSAVQFKKNDWIIFVRWYEFVPTRKKGEVIGFIKGICPMDTLRIDYSHIDANCYTAVVWRILSAQQRDK